MPCLNEAETLAACIEKAQGFLARTGIEGEVLISDNGSTDGTTDLHHHSPLERRITWLLDSRPPHTPPPEQPGSPG